MVALRGPAVLVCAALAFASCSTTPSESPPRATSAVSAQTSPPETTSSNESPRAPDDTPDPSIATDPGGASAIVPGTVERTSLDVSATYDVNAAITVDTGALEVATVLAVRNDSGAGIDRLELNTIAARLGSIRITEATVDDVPVKLVVDDQTLRVPLGGVLAAGASATVRIAYRATLRRGLTGSDWMFTRASGTLALYRWIPWISAAVPFDRPNHGDPFVTPSSPQVDIEIVTDEPMVLAAPATDISEVAAGSGQAWAFTVRDVREVSILLAPDFSVTEGEVGGVPIRVFSRSGSRAGERLLDLAAHAVSAEAERLDVAYPWPVLAVVETQGGEALESPGLIWIPDDVDTLNRTYLVHHEIAHQWFYGLVGNDQQGEPFADEAAADLLARTTLGTLRASRCSRTALDRAITAYSRSCYYEVIYVQGGLVLDDIRKRMGTERFWEAIKGYLDRHRFGLAGTRELLDTLRDASPTDLLPTLRARFPTLY